MLRWYNGRLPLQTVNEIMMNANLGPSRDFGVDGRWGRLRDRNRYHASLNQGQMN